MYAILEMIAGGTVFLTGFLVTFFCTPIIANYMRKYGIVGIDVHKPSKPSIPEMGGLGILVGIIVAIVMSSYFFPALSTTFVAFLFAVLIAGIIGIIDDLHGLHPAVKPILTTLACLPIFILHTYSEHPILPFIGRVRLTVVYPFLLPLAIAIPANAVNMLDPLNGVMSGTSLIMVFTFLLCALLFNRPETVILSLCLLGVLLAFHNYNKYPAKVFSGDTGSLTVGAGIGALAIMGSLENVGVVVLLPQLMNAFYILSGLRKLSRHESWPRPIELRNDGLLSATDYPDAPITLTRMVLARGPLEETEVIRIFFLLTAFCSILALTTAFIMVRSI